MYAGLAFALLCASVSAALPLPEERHVDTTMFETHFVHGTEHTNVRFDSITADPAVRSCFVFLSGANSVVRAEIISGGAVGFNKTTLCLMPLPHSFSWALSMDPVEGVAYAMGGRGTTSRTLYTVDIASGNVLFAPTVGYIYNTAFHLAADLRGNGRLYGMWSDESWVTQRPVEIDRHSGTVKHYLTPANWTPAGDTGCTQNVQLSTSAGYFSNRSASYITMWTCNKASYVVSIGVDGVGGSVRYWPIWDFASSGYSPFVTDFGVHPATGRAFVLRNTAQRVREVYDVSEGPIVPLSRVLSITVPSATWDLSMYQLTFMDNSVCVFRPQDDRRAHADPSDLVCAGLRNEPARMDGAGSFEVDHLAREQTFLPYVAHSIPVPCPAVLAHQL